MKISKKLLEINKQHLKMLLI